MPIIQLTDLMIQTAFILKALLPIKLSLSLGGQESDAGSVDSEPQDAQQVLSGETNEAAAADSASNDQLTVKNVSVSAHVQNIGWMDPVSRVRLPEPRVGA